MNKHSETVQLAQQLINIESITPHDNGCQTILSQQLESLGFEVSKLTYGDVSNLWARRGNNAPLIIFSGHTDVVPPGPENKWTTPPFYASTRDGYMYGRGAADMKSALAAMLMACKEFINEHPNHKGSIGFMITSDEEGPAINGTRKLVEYVKENNIQIDYCVIGEASSIEKLGDSIKIGRRGSLHGKLKVIGKQGHIAYPQLADNPIHRCFSALDALTQIEWDQGNEHFTPTSFQIYNINADTGASNIIPGALTASFNFRFAPSSTSEQLKEKVHKVFDDHGLQYSIDWNESSKPFFSSKGKLTEAAQIAIQEICNVTTNPNTTGGTSDGRFIADTGCEIVELGAVSKCIHQVDEYINIDDLNTLTRLYRRILELLLL
ncbi:MAG: succinyl-diaminopimelate desuccinylase [Gammaproteobacteria bacterium]|nr:succinyl-diaminopimelate desuccinylase [Gammaproteobacteria bacterium]